MESASLASVVAQLSQLTIALPGHIGRARFSMGIEQHPHSAASLRVGRFSDGIEQHPDRPAKLRVGRFSDGIAQLAEDPGTLRLGSSPTATTGSHRTPGMAAPQVASRAGDEARLQPPLSRLMALPSVDPAPVEVRRCR